MEADPVLELSITLTRSSNHVAYDRRGILANGRGSWRILRTRQVRRHSGQCRWAAAHPRFADLQSVPLVRFSGVIEATPGRLGRHVPSTTTRVLPNTTESERH